MPTNALIDSSHSGRAGATLVSLFFWTAGKRCNRSLALPRRFLLNLWETHIFRPVGLIEKDIILIASGPSRLEFGPP